MDIRFVGQPFADGSDLRDYLEFVASDDSLADLTIVVAWAKRSGLRRARALLETIRARGGRMRILVGIDEGGATKQGLELAMELFDEAHVFHDETGRTFHPKIYVSSGEGFGELFIGSNNMTAGGLHFNYEAALACRLDLSDADDRRLYDDVMGYVERLYADRAACLELRDDTLQALLENPRYRIGDEDRVRRPTVTEDDAPEDTDSEGEEPSRGAALFGRSAEAKRAGIQLPRESSAGGGGTRPGRPTPAGRSATTSSAAAASGAAAVPAAATSTTAVVVRRRWFKKMAASDAQHPPTEESNVTGVLRLTQARLGIDQTRYFRHDFFGGLAWTNVGTVTKPKEQVIVPFDVTIDGRALGLHNLMITHAAHREADQHNVTTVLHWGDLGPEMSAHDYTNYYVVLERLSMGTFRLSVVPTDPGVENFIE